MTYKTFYIKSYGCQMNVYDATRMATALQNWGGGQEFCATDDAQKADIVVLNSCHIREKAAEKIYSDLGRLRRIKQTRPDMVIGVAGCVAQAEGEEICRRAPEVDLIFGPQTIQDLPAMLDEHRKTKKPIIRLDFPAQEKFAALGRLAQAEKKYIPRRTTAFLTIQEGCDKFCTFCVVPYTRGGEVSRTQAEIITEAHALRDSGICEITLLGQNVNAWACPQTKARLADLLAALAQIEGIERLRFTTSHPRDMDDDLIAAYGTNKKLMPHLHLPIQSGSDRILHAMNRQHTADDYIKIIECVRAVRPDIAISSDFIAGFPQESDTDFEATLALIDKIGFAQAYSFKYSPRPGTAAADIAEQVPEAEKTARLQILQKRLAYHQQCFNAAQIGQILPVLFESRQKGAGSKYRAQLSGRSPYLQAVHINFDTKTGLDENTKGDFYGKCLPVKIEAAGDFSLRGRLAPSHNA